MKMRAIAPREAPIDTRIAMSLCFSITIRISVATMLRAATITMRPMVIAIAVFSSHRAENRLWFMSIQSWVMKPSPRAWRIDRSTSLTAYMSSTRTSTRDARSSDLEQALRRAQGEVGPGRVELVEAAAHGPGDAVARHPRQDPHRRQPPLRRHDGDDVARRRPPATWPGRAPGGSAASPPRSSAEDVELAVFDLRGQLRDASSRRRARCP